MRRVLVTGDGVAGLSCAQLLLQRGWRVRMAARSGAGVRDLVLNPITADMVRQLWGFEPARIPSAWQLAAHSAVPGVAPVKQVSVALPQALLLQAMRERLTACILTDSAHAEAEPGEWLVDAGGRPAPGRPALRFGRRHARACRVRLHARARQDTSMFEALPGAWLFLAPLGGGDAVLQAVMADAEAAPPLRALVGSSPRLAAVVVDLPADPPVMPPVPSMPVLSSSPAEHGRLAIGDAALAFDPLCGDGVGGALRTAALAAGVLEAIEDGGSLRPLLEHHECRLRAATVQHVTRCLAFYGELTGWNAEIAAMVAGLAALARGRTAAATGEIACQAR